MLTKTNILFVLFILLINMFFMVFMGCTDDIDDVAVEEKEEWNYSEMKTYSDEEKILSEVVNLEINDYPIYAVGDCALFQDNYDRDQCFIQCGEYLNKHEVCAYTNNPDECYYLIGQKGNLEACKKISNDVQQECYYGVGLNFGNLEACELYGDGPDSEKCYLSAYELNSITDCSKFNRLKQWCEFDRSIDLSHFNSSRIAVGSDMFDCFVWTLLNNNITVIGLQDEYSSLGDYYNVTYFSYNGTRNDNSVRSFVRNNHVDYMILDSVPDWKLETGMEIVYNSSCVVLSSKSSSNNLLGN